MTNNPNINNDPRHQAITLAADGVPLFKDLNAGSAWIFVARSANLPDGLSAALSNVHMTAFEMSDHLTADPITGLPEKIRRESKSFDPIITRLTDDLLNAQNQGYKITDHSKPEDSVRAFYLKVVLLFIVGDYPGQGKLSNFIHSGE